MLPASLAAPAPEFDLGRVVVIILLLLGGFFQWLVNWWKRKRAEAESMQRPPPTPEELEAMERAWQRQTGEGDQVLPPPPARNPLEELLNTFRELAEPETVAPETMAPPAAVPPPAASSHPGRRAACPPAFLRRSKLRLRRMRSCEGGSLIRWQSAWRRSAGCARLSCYARFSDHQKPCNLRTIILSDVPSKGRRGEIGRRARLKILYERSCVGSSPSAGTCLQLLEPREFDGQGMMALMPSS